MKVKLKLDSGINTMGFLFLKFYKHRWTNLESYEKDFIFNDYN